MKQIVNFSKGFTLSELLISLAILGLIAAFAIPKVLQTVETQQKRAILKEMAGALSETVYAGVLDGSLVGKTQTQVINKLMTLMQITNQCKGYVACQYSVVGNPMATGDDTLILPNGGWIIIRKYNATDWLTFIWLDHNGASPPNTLNADVFSCWANLTDQAQNDAFGNSYKPAQLKCNNIF